MMTTTRHRRIWTNADKARLVEEASQPGKTVSGVARKAGIAPSQLFSWRRVIAKDGQTTVLAGVAEDLVCPSGVPDLQKRVRELERLLGKKTMEAELLKEALQKIIGAKEAPRRISWNENDSR